MGITVSLFMVVLVGRLNRVVSVSVSASVSAFEIGKIQQVRSRRKSTCHDAGLIGRLSERAAIRSCVTQYYYYLLYNYYYELSYLLLRTFVLITMNFRTYYYELS